MNRMPYLYIHALRCIREIAACGCSHINAATRIEAHICDKCTCDTDTFLDMKSRVIKARTEKQATKKQKIAETEVDAEVAFGAEVEERKPVV